MLRVPLDLSATGAKPCGSVSFRTKPPSGVITRTDGGKSCLASPSLDQRRCHPGRSDSIGIDHLGGEALFVFVRHRHLPQDPHIVGACGVAISSQLVESRRCFFRPIL
ncbi:hypothetical protein BJF93_10340 [Xaviernesmea oryzae]|uniref:Uncharacterized protein n=1 Tax=Xaviernesmea oryzae TaxID=464029 RepID=A0A1Q9AWZ5_9HYPH|nr:hypothetical protein BJF93_10340 [Xaviernesmea oryzae]